jgi:hypothetical protein
VGILIAIAVVLGACYSPTLRDCALACDRDGDCAGGQTCSADHLCTWSMSRCNAVEHADGGLAVVDAHAPTKHDAARDELVIVHVHVAGNGRVTLDGIASCDAAAPQHGDCVLLAPVDVPAILIAVPHAGAMFDRWTGDACTGQGATCTFTPTTAVDVTAKFETMHDLP